MSPALAGGFLTTAPPGKPLDCILNYSLMKTLAEGDSRGFPGGAVVKNLPANAGDMSSIPGPERSHMPRSN